MKKLEVFVPLLPMYRVVDVSTTLNPALVSLHANGLVGNWKTGALPSPVPDYPHALDELEGMVPAMSVTPTSRGIDLYLWGLGLGVENLPPKALTLDQIVAAPLDSTPRVPDVVPAQKPKS